MSLHDDLMYEVPGSRLRELREAAARVQELERAVDTWAEACRERTAEKQAAEARVQELGRERDELQRRVEKDRYEFSREAEAAEAALAESAKREGEWRRKFGRAAHELNEAEAALADMRRALTEQHGLLWLVGLDTHDGEEPQDVEASVSNLRKLLADRALAAADSGTAPPPPDPRLEKRMPGFP